MVNRNPVNPLVGGPPNQGEPIFVTRPLLPPLSEFVPYLEQIWESRWVTNQGRFHAELEQRLCEYLGVDHLSLFANGTIALITALQSLDISGEVITTPYSFVATAHSLVWNNITPVFADVQEWDGNLDPERIEEAVTERTTAIMPVHCYGSPCDIEGIQSIADRYGLKVIYDAAHAFAVRRGNVSVLRHGDLSILSFHATKTFHTFEGGAIISPTAVAKQKIDYLKNFGFADEVTVTAVGINGKMNEVQAAMGLLQLKHVDAAIEARALVAARYRSALANVRGICVFPEARGFSPNYSYFPILVGNGYRETRDELYERMRSVGVIVRRYFYPLISDMPMYRGLESAAAENLPTAKRIADQVLCLPIYADLGMDQVDSVIDLIV